MAYAEKSTVTLHQLVYLALFLAVIAVVLGALGTKAFHDVEVNPNDDQEMRNLKVNGELSVRNSTIYRNHGHEKRTSTSRLHDIGTRMILDDGSVFRYAYSNGVLPAGQLVQEAAGIAAHDMDLTVASASIGATQITVTPGAAAVTANQYAGGYLYVNDGAGGEGQVYRIASNPAALASTAFVVTLREPITQAFVTGATLVGLKANPYFDVIPAPIVPTGRILGTTRADVPDNTHFWLQTWGEASVLIARNPGIVGHTLVNSPEVVGAAHPDPTGLDIFSGTKTAAASRTGIATTDSAVPTTRVMVSQGGNGTLLVGTTPAVLVGTEAETYQTLIYSFRKADFLILPVVGDVLEIGVEGTVSASNATVGVLKTVITATVVSIFDGGFGAGIASPANYHLQLNVALIEPTPDAAVTNAATFTITGIKMVRPAANYQPIGKALMIPAVDTDYQLSFLEISA